MLHFRVLLFQTITRKEIITFLNIFIAASSATEVHCISSVDTMHLPQLEMVFVV